MRCNPIDHHEKNAFSPRGADSARLRASQHCQRRSRATDRQPSAVRAPGLFHVPGSRPGSLRTLHRPLGDRAPVLLLQRVQAASGDRSAPGDSPRTPALRSGTASRSRDRVLFSLNHPRKRRHRRSDSRRSAIRRIASGDEGAEPPTAGSAAVRKQQRAARVLVLAAGGGIVAGGRLTARP